MINRRFGSTPRAVAVAFLTIACTSFAGVAFAQQPSPAQVSAVKSNCRSDYMQYCSSVPTGTSASLQCLEQNVAKLSGSCQAAVSAAVSTVR